MAEQNTEYRIKRSEIEHILMCLRSIDAARTQVEGVISETAVTELKNSTLGAYHVLTNLPEIK